jgi:hypothetical protein
MSDNKDFNIVDLSKPGERNKAYGFNDDNTNIKSKDDLPLRMVTEQTKDAIIARMEATYRKILNVNKELKRQGSSEVLRVADVLENIPVSNIFRLVFAEAWNNDEMMFKLKGKVGELDSRLIEGLSRVNLKVVKVEK